MALYVIYEKADDLHREPITRELCLHMGMEADKAIRPQMVTHLQADGHELEAIYDQFENIPNCDQHVVQFYGDIARFIYANLDLSKYAGHRSERDIDSEVIRRYAELTSAATLIIEVFGIEADYWYADLSSFSRDSLMQVEDELCRMSATDFESMVLMKSSARIQLLKSMQCPLIIDDVLSSIREQLAEYQTLDSKDKETADNICGKLVDMYKRAGVYRQDEVSILESIEQYIKLSK